MDVANLSDAVASLATNPNLKSASQQALAKSNSKLDMEAFLKIMAASMSNPSFSGDSSSGGASGATDYVSQLAQFSVLQELTDLETTIAQSAAIQQQQQAFALMGKKVMLNDGQGSTIEGTVSGVQFLKGYAKLMVNGQAYSMGNLIQVGDAK